MTENRPPHTRQPVTWRGRIHRLYRRFKALQGDPHYIAMGTAIGVFVGFTPTIPLHTAIAIGLAFIFKASKPAAVIAVWVGNPVTIPFFYYAAFEMGKLMIGHDMPLHGTIPGVTQLVKMGWDVALAMIVGGAILGIVPAVAAYFIAFHLFRRVKARRQARKSKRDDHSGSCDLTQGV